MNKTIKVALSMLLIFCVFFANMCTVFAVDGSQSTTDGEHGGGGMPFPDADGGLTEYDGSLVTYDYAKKNPKLFKHISTNNTIKNLKYDVDMSPPMIDGLNQWIEKGQTKNTANFVYEFIRVLWEKDFEPTNELNTQYVYWLVEYFSFNFCKQTLVFSDYPAKIIDGHLLVEQSNFYAFQNYNSESWSTSLVLLNYEASDGKKYYDFGLQNVSMFDPKIHAQSVVYPINGKIMPILDGGGNDITPPEHGGGGRPFGNIYDITVSPDLASKDFDVGEIDKIDITITNNSNTNGCFAVNFSKYSAKNTSPRTVMDEAAIFNYREKLHMYDVNGEGRYMYTPAIPLSAKSSKTISIPISYLDLSKLPKDDNGYIYMNFMELAGSVKPGLVSTQFKANKEYYFKLNFKPEYKPPEYGGGTSNEQYPTYDKDGNIVKPSDDPVFEDDWLNWGSNFLKNVTDIFSRIIDGMKSIAEYSGEFFSFLKSAFSFLPPEVWVILAVGISIVILLRIFGR